MDVIGARGWGNVGMVAKFDFWGKGGRLFWASDEATPTLVISAVVRTPVYILARVRARFLQ